MKNGRILVAGAGHGGLAAAILLARKGFDVTVLEACEEEALGYDWRDCIDIRCFTDAGLEAPSETLEYMQPIHYFNPRKTVRISPPDGYQPGSLLIERKALLRHLLSLARESGVYLCFSRRVTGAVTEGARVTGVLTDAGRYDADLVIDAAGMDSPVRQSLPASCGIMRMIRPEDTLFTYRALYEKTDMPSDMPPFCAYFFASGQKGFDWVIREADAVDVLIGVFGGITPQIAQAAVESFRQDHPDLGETIVRGGTYAKIPLRRTLPQFVCDGYAAIGDSASMIEPLSGSGMSLSLRSAAMLASTAAASADFSKASLWPYVTAYFQKTLRMILRQTTLKDTLMQMGEKNINVMFEKQIMTRKELYGGKQDARDILHKILGTLSAPSLVPVFLKMQQRQRAMVKLPQMLPEEYDDSRVAAWIQAYEQF